MATITEIRQLESTLTTTTALALGGMQVTTGHAGGISAIVEQLTEEGFITFHVTRLDGEEGWTVDAAYRGSFPMWANGEGARYLRTRQISDATIVAQLDEAAAQIGLRA